MTRLAFAALIPVLLASTTALAQDKTDMQDARSVELKGTDGASMGTASFVPTPHGVLIEADLQNLPGGTHGFHIHETGVCEGDFTSAGGHYNPADDDHGYMSETGPHAGDMPNVVATDGAVEVSVFNPKISMTGDAPLDSTDKSFPYMRIRESVAILGVSTAEATAPFFATGTFNRGQALRLAKMLETARALGLFRVVLIHHPPISGSTSWHKRLIGKQFFSKVMREVGAELVLHGHTHLDTLHWLKGPEKQIPVVGVPSASQAPGSKNPASRYNLFEITGGPSTWTLIQRERGICEDTPGIGWVRQRELLADGRAIDARPREDAKEAV